MSALKIQHNINVSQSCGNRGIFLKGLRITDAHLVQQTIFFTNDKFKVKSFDYLSSIVPTGRIWNDLYWWYTRSGSDHSDPSFKVSHGKSAEIVITTVSNGTPKTHNGNVIV
jgi:hypothetical protein